MTASGRPAPGAPPYSSHKGFTHGTFDSLGYDWERIAQPAIPPRPPFKVYLPRTTDDVVRAVREARTLGERLRVRANGHSSNDLVLDEGGTVLCTEQLNRILHLDEANLTVTVQAGIITAELDAALAERGLGLPIIGDHNHITAGGFAAVGGIGPASHRYGLFVDNIESVECVTWDGEVVSCGRHVRPDLFFQVLTSCSREGVIVTLTIDVIRVDKYRTVVRNWRSLYRHAERFIEDSERWIKEPGDLYYERGAWVDLGRLKFGQFSRYAGTRPSLYKSLWNALAYGYLHALGRWSGRLSDRLNRFLKYLGIVGVVLSPRYATMKNVETFTDRILDSTVGDPTRWFIVLAPVKVYARLFREIYGVAVDLRERQDCFTFVSCYVKAIKSAYLTKGRPDGAFVELMLYTGIKPGRFTTDLLNALVERIDRACIDHGAFRYMHTRTSRDPTLRRQIDPNTPHAVTEAQAS